MLGNNHLTQKKTAKENRGTKTRGRKHENQNSRYKSNYINNNSKYEWIKQASQKAKIASMLKTRSNYMLSIRDTL